MLVVIQLMDDEGRILDEYRGDMMTPYVFNTHYERPLRQGVRSCYGYTFQPIVKLDLKQAQIYDAPRDK